MRLYFDAMAWIYALEGNPVFGASAQALLGSVKRGRHRLVTSHFLLAETLVLPIRKGDLFLIGAYRQALLRTDSTEVATFDEAAAMTFANLRAGYRLKSPDAMHLAIAASAQVDAFITTDEKLLKLAVAGIGFIGDLSTPLP